MKDTSAHVNLRRSREILLMGGIRSKREASTEVSRCSNERQVSYPIERAKRQDQAKCRGTVIPKRYANDCRRNQERQHESCCQRVCDMAPTVAEHTNF